MSLKPIEAGCLAVIIKSRFGNVGKVGRVGRFLGKVHGFVGEDQWEFDVAINTKFGNIVYFARESNMLRIDGEDFSHEVFEEELEKTK